MTIRVIQIPSGRQVSLGEYVRCWKLLLTVPASQQVKGWSWYSESAGEVLRNISAGVHDRINQRGGLTPGKPMTATRTLRHLRRTVQVGCRWCGTPLAQYELWQNRFCSMSCRKDQKTN